MTKKDHYTVAGGGGSERVFVRPRTCMRVNITIPAFNEEKTLPEAIHRLHPFLKEHLRRDWEIVIANNGSTDRTLMIAGNLQREYPGLRVVRSEQKGRGGVLRRVWMESDAEILSYMDADLSTELEAFVPMIESLITGEYDIATGSRLLKPELTTRGFRREFISRSYNRIARAVLQTRFSDAQCGFKALTRKTARAIIPLTTDTGWFFDTELLTFADKLGFKIHDMPVRWIESRQSHVRVVPTAIRYLAGLLRLRRQLQSNKSS